MAASKLIRPLADFKDSYLEALKEYHAEGLFPSQKHAELHDHFDHFVDRLRNERDHPQHEFPDWVEPVPETVLWMVKDGTYIGSLNIRHRLNWHLERWGGHVGLIIRPSMRRKGFGTKLLQRGIPYINYLGVDNALLTIAPDNDIAIKVAERCGAVFEDEMQETEQFPAMHRYWLNCQ